jgi:hypothetical protein
MKTSTVKKRRIASALALVSAGIFGLAGSVHAQYGDIGPGQAEPPMKSGTQTGNQQREVGEKGILKEGFDQGQVEQRKRNERNKDPRSPSPDSHVQDPPRDKDGNIIRDPSQVQGGPMGPN